MNEYVDWFNDEGGMFMYISPSEGEPSNPDQFTKEQLFELKKFMEEEVIFIEERSYSGAGKWKIEVPARVRNECWVSLAHRLIPTALNECDPVLSNADATIRFSPRIVVWDQIEGNYYPYSIRARMYSITDQRRAKFWIRLSDLEIDNDVQYLPDTPWYIAAMGALFHEVFEMDYHIQQEQQEGYSLQRNIGHPNYRQATHERIANERTIAHFQKEIGINITIDPHGRYIIS